MFDSIAPTELLVCAVVALIVIGPKDLPKALRVVGQWVAKVRGYARHFRSGVDAMIRESEIADLEKSWAEQNAKIMAEYPLVAPDAMPDMTPNTQPVDDVEMVPVAQAAGEPGPAMEPLPAFMPETVAPMSRAKPKPKSATKPKSLAKPKAKTATKPKPQSESGT